MHGHYLLKLTVSLAQVRKRRCILLYSCESFVLYLMGIISAYGHEVLFILSWIKLSWLPELFEESHQSFSAQFFLVSNLPGC